MLTVKQPTTYGYKSVHDLPTPPSTSRPSPPLIKQESIPKSLPVSYRSHSPPTQSMSAPHRGLPPPAAMTLPPQQPPTAGVPPPAHHAPPPPPPSLGPSYQQRDSWGQLPAPPQQWQGAEESMKHWLQARAEEDRRRQEEERTRQESLRLEQRKLEMEMLRTSLSGGIPPAMVPLVFAGMAGGGGGALSQAAGEWMQQFLPPSQTPRAQIMPPQGPVSPEHQREGPPPGSVQYHSLPPSAAPPPAGYGYPGSPTRPRGQTVGATVGRPVTNLPSLNTNVPHPAAHASTPAMAPQQHLQLPQPPPPQESQTSASIYFHHWQPPTTQASSSSNRPGSPSGEAPRKRRATGQHQPVPSPPQGELRHRSPPSYPPSVQSNVSQRGRYSRHTRQRSDFSPYRSSGPGRARRESFGGSTRRMSPMRSSTPGPRLRTLPKQEASERGETQKPSVSSMLSEEPGPPSQQPVHAHAPERGEGRRQTSPPADSRAYVGVEGTVSSRDGAGEGDGA